jgi:chromosome condensin MukBEF ATPase and DNA-binding subunit MukB
MSESFRERIRRRKDQLNLTDQQADFVEKYIEQFCAEADKRCKTLSPLKAVDMVIDEMTDSDFDEFAKSIVSDVTDRMDKAKQKKKRKTIYDEVEEEPVYPANPPIIRPEKPFERPERSESGIPA